ncbi:MAG: hypothetical protein IPI81_16790 [Flavobacteriales bacterium]|nr:hypothetical protein [Flavobacteriales bacterium]MCC6939456.1 hypothetical protein [Flavobacteriales bacterium]
MSFQRWCFLIAAVVYVTAAWFGVGYSAEDEFQQVILYAEHLRGHVDVSALPLDYHQQWRSMVLPLICTGVFKVCALVGITDPFILTLMLRLLTAALALWITNRFIRSVLPTLHADHTQAFTLFSWFLWFVPLLQIRFSGETWSGLLFLHALGMIMDDKRRNPLVIGSLFALVIVLRPAAGFLPFGAMLWMLLIKRSGRTQMLRMIGAGVVVLITSAVLDSVVYGKATSTLWNYATAGITGEEAVRFTALPMYQYVLFTVKYATVPIGVLLITAFTCLIALRPKHVLIWVLLPFLIIHSILPVKELRFLFPLAPLMPWLLISAWEALHDRWPVLMSRTIWLRALFFFAAVNVLALLVGITTPAGNGRIALAREARDHFKNRSVHVDILGDWRMWIPPFYLSTGSTEVFSEKIIVNPKVNGPTHLVIARRSEGLDRVTNLERLAIATPRWADQLLTWYHLEDQYDPLVLYRVTTEHIGH